MFPFPSWQFREKSCGCVWPQFHCLSWGLGEAEGCGLTAASQSLKKRNTQALASGLVFFFFFFKYLFLSTWLCRVLVEACRMFNFSLWTLSCGIWYLVPWPGIKPGPPALGAQPLSHWSTREGQCLVYVFKSYTRLLRPAQRSGFPGDSKEFPRDLLTRHGPLQDSKKVLMPGFQAGIFCPSVQWMVGWHTRGTGSWPDHHTLPPLLGSSTELLCRRSSRDTGSFSQGDRIHSILAR